MNRKRPKFVPIGNVNALGEVARRYSIQTVVDNVDWVDHRSGDCMSQDQRKNETCQRDGGDKYRRSSIGLPARIYAGYHVRLSPVDQLIGQSFELVREGTELHEFPLFRVGPSPVTDEIDDVGNYGNEARIFVAHLVEQRNLVLFDKRDAVKAVPKLVDLP